MRRKLLAVCYGGGHVNIIKSMYGELSKKFEVTILPLTTAKDVLKKEGIPFKDLEFYNGVLNDGADIVKIGTDFIENHSIDYRKIGFLDSALYYGYSVRDFTEQYGEKSLDNEYYQYGRLIFCPKKTMRMIIEYEKPDGILTTNSPRFERAALLVSKEMGIPNFSIEDLFGFPRLISVKEDKLSRKYYGDYIFVMNHFTKENIEKLGILPKDIYVSGSPAFDKGDAFLCYKSNYYMRNDDRYNVLYLSNKSEKRFEILERILEFLNELNINYNLVVKLHPSEMVVEYKKYSSQVQIEEGKLYDSILKSDIIITNCSTSSIEAAYLDKDVVNIATGVPKAFSSFFKALGTTYFASNYCELKMYIEQLYYKKTIEPSVQIKRRSNSNIGSAKRITEYINNIL